MKKLLTLAVAGCMVLGSLGTASAVDVKVKGQWWFQYSYLSNNTLTSKDDSGAHSDRLRARQRIRTQIQFIADENLSALLNMEANLNWGSTGGAIDADKEYFKIKHAYLDWTIPNTQVKTRMGMQGMRFPYAVMGNPVLNADVAGITVSAQMTPELGLTGFWLRPFSEQDDFDNQQNGKNNMDDMDVFGFMLPIKTDAVRATPWGAVAIIGQDSGYFGAKGAGSIVGGGKDGKGGNGSGRGRYIDTKKTDSTVYGWWLGSSFEVPALDPFVLKLDAMMGGMETGDSDYDSFGYLLAAEVGYKFNFGRLSAIGWYASGDKDDDKRGIMPIISDDTGLGATFYGLGGGRNREFDSVVSHNGLGMWGIGLQLADVSFVDKLTHKASVFYMGGTNKGDSVRRRTVVADGDDTFGDGFYMTSDRAWEVSLMNEYKMSQNLSFTLDLSYVWLDLGDHWKNSEDTKGSFATAIGVAYSF